MLLLQAEMHGQGPRQPDGHLEHELNYLLFDPVLNTLEPCLLRYPAPWET